VASLAARMITTTTITITTTTIDALTTRKTKEARRA
jgi:hypothetical protein